MVTARKEHDQKRLLEQHRRKYETPRIYGSEGLHRAVTIGSPPPPPGVVPPGHPSFLQWRRR